MIEKDKHYNVTVVKILERGAVVEISGIDGRTGFIHISNIAECFVSNIADFLSVGNTYDGICIDTEKYGFSLKHLGLKSNYVPKRQEHHHTERAERSSSRSKGQPPEFSSSGNQRTGNIDDMIARANACLKDKQKHRAVFDTGYKKRRSKQSPDAEDFD